MSDAQKTAHRALGHTNGRCADCCVLGRFGGGSLMAWGGIMGGTKTGLVVMQGNLDARHYIDGVLRPHVILIPESSFYFRT